GRGESAAAVVSDAGRSAEGAVRWLASVCRHAQRRAGSANRPEAGRTDSALQRQDSVPVAPVRVEVTPRFVSFFRFAWLQAKRLAFRLTTICFDEHLRLLLWTERRREQAIDDAGADLGPVE